jgi:hypothetical protein
VNRAGPGWLTISESNFRGSLLKQRLRTQRTRRASKPNVAGVGVLRGGREGRWLGGNAPEDHGSSLLNGFQALAQQIGVSVPKLDVVGVMLGPT